MEFEPNGLSASSNRLRLSFDPEYQYYEYKAAMLWTNICASVFPMNTPDGFLFAPEFSHEKGRGDLVITQSHQSLKNHFWSIGAPFLVLEFKSANASSDEWERAKVQMEDGMRHIREYFDLGQIIFGARISGPEIEFYEMMTDGTIQAATVEFDIRQDEHIQQVIEYLSTIWNRSPAQVVQHWPNVG